MYCVRLVLSIDGGMEWSHCDVRAARLVLVLGRGRQPRLDRVATHDEGVPAVPVPAGMAPVRAARQLRSGIIRGAPASRLCALHIAQVPDCSALRVFLHRPLCISHSILCSCEIRDNDSSQEEQSPQSRVSRPQLYKHEDKPAVL